MSELTPNKHRLQVFEFLKELGTNITNIEYIAGEHRLHFDTKEGYVEYRQGKYNMKISLYYYIEFIFEKDDSIPTWLSIFGKNNIRIVTMSPSSIVSWNSNYNV